MTQRGSMGLCEDKWGTLWLRRGLLWISRCHYDSEGLNGALRG